MNYEYPTLHIKCSPPTSSLPRAETGQSGGVAKRAFARSHSLEVATEKFSHPTAFDEGEKIEAKYKGKARYYPGVVAKYHPPGSSSESSGTYDIDYDDGEKEFNVKAALIKTRDPTKVRPRLRPLS